MHKLETGPERFVSRKKLNTTGSTEGGLECVPRQEKRAVREDLWRARAWGDAPQHEMVWQVILSGLGVTRYYDLCLPCVTRDEYKEQRKVPDENTLAPSRRRPLLLYISPHSRYPSRPLSLTGTRAHRSMHLPTYLFAYVEHPTSALLPYPRGLHKTFR